MADNKKKVVTSKKTVAKTEVATNSENTIILKKSKKPTTTKINNSKDTKKKVAAKKVAKTSTLQKEEVGKNKKLDNSLVKKNVKKDKAITKKTAKVSKTQKADIEPKKDNSLVKKNKVKPKAKKIVVVNEVDNTNFSKQKKSFNKKYLKDIKISNIFKMFKSKLVKKENVKQESSKVEKKSSKNDKLNDSKKIVKTSIFATIKDRLVKSDKNPKVLEKTKKNKKTKSNSPIFTKKTKRLLIGIAIVCVMIIVLEISYLVYHQIEIDRHTTYYDSLNSLAIDDTDIIAVGSSNFKYSKHNDYTKGLEKAKFVKYDKNGKIIFEKMYNKGINTTFSSIISVNDGYVVVGSGEFSEQEQKDGAREAVIIKYDKDGNIVWEKYYQVVTNTRFNKVIATSDGYIAIGQSIYANMEMGNHTTGGGIIVKYDVDGNEVWHNNHGGMKSGNFNDVVEVNGNFYVVGKDATDSANIVKYDQDGQYKWHKNYSYTDGIGFTGIAYFDNALYVVGSKKILPEDYKENDSRDTTNTDALLVKYDLDGKVLFEKNFGGSNYERYNSILVYRSNLYIVGHTSSNDAGLRVDSDGELMTGILIRYDKDGNILKKESLGGSNNDNLTDIVTDSVSLYITGYSNSKDGNITTARNNGKDYFGKVIKLDFKFRTLMVK